MVTTRCHGRFFGGRNACDCPDCREKPGVFWAWHDASDRYFREVAAAGDLSRCDPAVVDRVVRADLARQAAGRRWEAWEQGGGGQDAEDGEPEAVGS
jgi:hypothetical protein